MAYDSTIPSVVERAAKLSCDLSAAAEWAFSHLGLNDGSGRQPHERRAAPACATPSQEAEDLATQVSITSDDAPACKTLPGREVRR